MSWKNVLNLGLKPPFSLDNQSGPAYFKVASLKTVKAGFTIRPGGFSEGFFASANMGFQVGDQDEKVKLNRQALLKGPGDGAFADLVTVRQVHGKNCFTVTDLNPEKLLGLAQIGADALLTDRPGVLLGVLTADCLPLIMIDRKGRAVAVVHAGWRGMEQSIGAVVVTEMGHRFAVLPEDIEVYAGPAIGACCFQVGAEVVESFSRLPALMEFKGWWQERATGYYVDLLAIQRIQLEATGVLGDNFHALDICTCCHDFCFSYRRDHAITGRQLAFVGINKKNR